MPKAVIHNMNGEKVGEIELSDAIFGIEPNESVIHDAVVMGLASLRRGTHDVKNRSEVRGGGRKPWRQKGTGRARQGSIRSPQWVGGGVVFGPTPRSYRYKLPKKMRRLAIKSALSSKVRDLDLIVLEKLAFDAPKTQEMSRVLESLQAKKALIVEKGRNENAELSLRNIPGTSFTTSNRLNVVDVLKYDKLIMTVDAIAGVEEVLGS